MNGEIITTLVATALGVGGATVIGALIGLFFKNISHKISDTVLAFASGVMLAAAVVGLILPSLSYGEGKITALLITIAGLFCGALFLNFLDKMLPHLHNLAGINEEAHPEINKEINRVLLFVLAIGIHNLPEGIAAGVSFGTEDLGAALTVSISIALQNIPEGMVIIGPMLSAGISHKRTFLIALMTGLVEVIGAFFGFFAVQISAAILPFALAFAGGTMLYVISDEMIPETHAHGHERGATYALLAGFALMLSVDFLLG